MIVAILVVLALGDPVAEAQALAERDGIAAFDAIFLATVAERDWRVQGKMIGILASLGAEAVPLAVACVTRENPPPRWRECSFMTLQRLSRRDDTIEVLIPLIVHSNRALARVVRDGLKREAAIPALLAVFRQDDRKLRNEARAILRTHGAKLQPHLKHDPDPGFRVQLVPLLAAAGALDELAAWVRDPDQTVRLQVVAEFGRHTKNASAAVPVLLAALVDAEAGVRTRAAGALANFAAEADRIAPAVAPLARDPDPRVREAALETLAKLGQPAHPFIQRELTAAKSGRRLAMAKALGAGDDEVLSLIGFAMKDTFPAVRVAAIRALERKSKGLPLLLRALDDKAVDAQVAALTVIESLGAEAATAAPHIAKRIGVKQLSGFVVRALRAMGPKALASVLDIVPLTPPDTSFGILRVWPRKDVVTALAKLLVEDTLAARRRAGAWALGRYGEVAAAAVPALVQALGDKDGFVVTQAAWALGQIGPAAKAAVPALRAKLEDAALRPVLRDALKRIAG